MENCDNSLRAEFAGLSQLDSRKRIVSLLSFANEGSLKIILYSALNDSSRFGNHWQYLLNDQFPVSNLISKFFNGLDEILDIFSESEISSLDENGSKAWLFYDLMDGVNDLLTFIKLNKGVSSIDLSTLYLTSPGTIAISGEIEEFSVRDSQIINDWLESFKGLMDYIHSFIIMQEQNDIKYLYGPQSHIKKPGITPMQGCQWMENDGLLFPGPGDYERFLVANQSFLEEKKKLGVEYFKSKLENSSDLHAAFNHFLYFDQDKVSGFGHWEFLLQNESLDNADGIHSYEPDRRLKYYKAIKERGRNAIVAGLSSFTPDPSNIENLDNLMTNLIEILDSVCPETVKSYFKMSNHTSSKYYSRDIKLIFQLYGIDPNIYPEIELLFRNHEVYHTMKSLHSFTFTLQARHYVMLDPLDGAKVHVLNNYKFLKRYLNRILSIVREESISPFLNLCLSGELDNILPNFGDESIPNSATQIQTIIDEIKTEIS